MKLAEKAPIVLGEGDGKNFATLYERIGGVGKGVYLLKEGFHLGENARFNARITHLLDRLTQRRIGGDGIGKPLREFLDEPLVVEKPGYGRDDARLDGHTVIEPHNDTDGLPAGCVRTIPFQIFADQGRGESETDDAIAIGTRRDDEVSVVGRRHTPLLRGFLGSKRPSFFIPRSVVKYNARDQKVPRIAS